MKMVFLSKNNKNNKKQILFWITGLFLVAIFYFGGLSFLTSPLHYAGKPLWWLKNSSLEMFSDFTGIIKFKKTLVEENEELEKKVNQLSSQEIFSKLLLEENKELKELLGRQTGDYNFILANVLAKPNLSPYDSLILDIGKESGIKKGDKIISQGNIVIGEVEEVYNKTTKAFLYSFPGKSLNVAIGINEIIGTAEGKGSGNFEIKFPRGVFVEEGDIITLPGLDLFILGVVNKVVNVSGDSFQTVLFKIPTNIFELKWVQILQE